MGKEVTMDKIVSLCKRRGFVFQSSEVYGGLSSAWDYGPLGAALMRNVQAAWWQKFVRESKYNVGMDSSILLNPKVWQASGHIGGFNDPLMDCKACKTRYRADQLIEDYNAAHDVKENIEGWSNEQLKAYVDDKNMACPTCGKRDFTDIRQFNLMFKTHQGVTEDSSTEIFLRPETAQGIFLNFKAVQRAARKKVPFGIAQIGKSFRNEITPGNFIFRTREFVQMELEFFCQPGTEMDWFSYWKQFCIDWLATLGLSAENTRVRDHAAEELSHYSNATSDIEYLFPFGWGELWGIASRTDFDLSRHMEYSGVDLQYQDPISNEKYIPYVIEPSLGANRVALAFLVDAYQEEQLDEKDSRIVLKLHPALAPFKAAVFPLSKKLSEPANRVYDLLRKHFDVDYDESGSIGKRYRRHDEIGTPFCITYDFDSAEDQAVTIRERDSMAQSRVPIAELVSYLTERLTY